MYKSVRVCEFLAFARPGECVVLSIMPFAFLWCLEIIYRMVRNMRDLGRTSRTFSSWAMAMTLLTACLRFAWLSVDIASRVGFSGSAVC